LVAALHQRRVEGDRAEEGCKGVVGELLAPAFLAEDRVVGAAVGAVEAAHVLDDPEDAQLERLREPEGLLDVERRDALGRRDDDDAVDVAD